MALWPLEIINMVPARHNQQVSSAVSGKDIRILYSNRLDKHPILVKHCNTIGTSLCYQDTAIRSDSETGWAFQLASANFPDILAFKSEDLDSGFTTATDIQVVAIWG